MTPNTELTQRGGFRGERAQKSAALPGSKTFYVTDTSARWATVSYSEHRIQPEELA